MPDPQDRPDSEPSDASTPPAKKLPAKKAAKKAPARKTPAKKALPKTPAKGAKSAPPKPAEAPVSLQQRIETNGQLAAAATMQRHKQSRQWKAPTTPWRATHQCRRRVTRPCR